MEDTELRNAVYAALDKKALHGIRAQVRAEVLKAIAASDEKASGSLSRARSRDQVEDFGE